MFYNKKLAGIVDLSAMIDGRKKKISKDFGINLKRVRREKKMSLRQLAASTELEHAQISRMEKGEVNPTLSTIIFLAEALQVDPAELLPNK